MKIDTATTAQWVYEGAQKKVQEAATLIQQSIENQRAQNRQKTEELAAMAAQPAKRSGGIDVYA